MTGRTCRSMVVIGLVWFGCGSPEERVESAFGADRIILVAGATGRQGGAVARELLERGYRVRALTRDSTTDRARELARRGAELAQGDLEDPASLAHALRGAYGAFSMQDYWEHGFDGEVRQGKNLADAAKDANVQHFVYSSVGSADRNTGIPHFESKYEIEEHIRALGLPYTILRPVSFMGWQSARTEVLSGRLGGALGPGSSSQYIAVQDIGMFAAEAFDNPREWIGIELDIAGDQLTMVELAAVFSRVIGRSVEYVKIPWREFVSAADPEMTAMMRWFEDVGYDADVAGLRERYSRLTSVEEYLRQHGWDSGRQEGSEP